MAPRWTRQRSPKEESEDTIAQIERATAELRQTIERLRGVVQNLKEEDAGGAGPVEH